MTKLKITQECAFWGNHVLGNRPTYIEKFTNFFFRELEAKKEQVIKDKFAEKGFAHLLEDVEKRRFKRVVVEQFDDCEKWWADDGTEQGVLIVTFLNSAPQFSNNIDRDFKITAEIKYY